MTQPYHSPGPSLVTIGPAHWSRAVRQSGRQWQLGLKGARSLSASKCTDVPLRAFGIGKRLNIHVLVGLAGRSDSGALRRQRKVRASLFSQYTLTLPTSFKATLATTRSLSATLSPFRRLAAPATSFYCNTARRVLLNFSNCTSGPVHHQRLRRRQPAACCLPPASVHKGPWPRASSTVVQQLRAPAPAALARGMLIDGRLAALGALAVGLTVTWLRKRGQQRNAAAAAKQRGRHGGVRLLPRGRPLPAKPDEVSLISYNILCQRYANSRRLPHVFAQVGAWACSCWPAAASGSWGDGSKERGKQQRSCCWLPLSLLPYVVPSGCAVPGPGVSLAAAAG